MSETKEKEETKQDVMWEITDEFKSDAINILSNLPFNQVQGLIATINEMKVVPEAEINAVLTEFSKLPYKDVANLIHTAQNKCKIVGPE